jgi:hypothetical protein
MFFRRLLVHSCQGARANFLTTILLNQFEDVNFNDIAIPLPNNVVKVVDFHNVECKKNLYTDFNTYDDLFTFAESHRLTTIRILPKNIDNIIDIAYLELVKYWNGYDDIRTILPNIAKLVYEHSLADKNYHHMYSLKIYFNQIFDYQTIISLYMRYNCGPYNDHNSILAPAVQQNVMHNLRIQPRLTVINKDEQMLEAIDMIKQELGTNIIF